MRRTKAPELLDCEKTARKLVARRESASEASRKRGWEDFFPFSSIVEPFTIVSKKYEMNNRSVYIIIASVGFVDSLLPRILPSTSFRGETQCWVLCVNGSQSLGAIFQLDPASTHALMSRIE
jgi:hypothetical protein